MIGTIKYQKLFRVPDSGTQCSKSGRIKIVSFRNKVDSWSMETLKHIIAIILIYSLSYRLAHAHSMEPSDHSEKYPSQHNSSPERRFVEPQQFNRAVRGQPSSARVKKYCLDDHGEPTIEVETIEECPSTRRQADFRKDPPVNIIGNISGNIGNDKAAAVILFTIVGAVMLIAWLPKVPELVDAAVTNDGEIETKRTLRFTSMAMETEESGVSLIGGQNQQVSRSHATSYTGLSYSYSVLDPDGDSTGVTFEFGSRTTQDSTFFFQSASRRYYGLVGPKAEFRMSENWHLDMAWLFGAAFSEGSEFISRADLGINYAINNYEIGLGLGGLYASLDRTAYGKDITNLGVSFGINVGYTF